jgi:hypothetical protein
VLVPHGDRVLDPRRREAHVVLPMGREIRVRNAPVEELLAIHITASFPRVDRREVRRIQRRHEPLDVREVRDARHPHLPRAPRLAGSPLDHVAAIGRLLLLVCVPRFSLGVPRPARIGTDDRVTPRTPERGVGALEQDMLLGDPLRPNATPGEAAIDREGRKVLAVRTPFEQDRRRLFVLGPVNVNVNRHTVAQLHGNIALDDHPRLADDAVTEPRMPALRRRSAGSVDDLVCLFLEHAPPKLSSSIERAENRAARRAGSTARPGETPNLSPARISNKPSRAQLVAGQCRYHESHSSAPKRATFLPTLCGGRSRKQNPAKYQGLGRRSALARNASSRGSAARQPSHHAADVTEIDDFCFDSANSRQQRGHRPLNRRKP